MSLAFLFMISEVHEIIPLCELNVLGNISVGPKCFNLAFGKAK